MMNTKSRSTGACFTSFFGFGGASLFESQEEILSQLKAVIFGVNLLELLVVHPEE